MKPKTAGSFKIPLQDLDFEYQSSETDVDCGGDAYKQCDVGERCLWNIDCLTFSCDKTTYTCVDALQHSPDTKEYTKWIKEFKPFDIFDKSPFIDPTQTLLKRYQKIGAGVNSSKSR